MIESLSITNFQTHRKLELDFDPTVTTIIGATDAGKSAILRALRWVCFNYPYSQHDILNYDADWVRAAIIVDGRKITRRRGDGSNYYKLDSHRYDAIKTSVPETIEQLLNLSEVSYHDQHDQAFWFSLPAGQVSKELNQIVNLGVMDEAVATVAARLRKARASVEVAHERLAKSKKTKIELAWVPEMSSAWHAVKQLGELRDIARQKTVSVKTSVEQAQRAVEARDLARQACTNGENLLRTGKLARGLGKQTITLRALVASARDAEAKAKLKIPDPPSADRVKIANQKRWKLQTFLELVKTTDLMVKTVSEKLKQARQELKPFEGKVCPTCGRPMR